VEGGSGGHCAFGTLDVGEGALCTRWTACNMNNPGLPALPSTEAEEARIVAMIARMKILEEGHKQKDLGPEFQVGWWGAPT
jgi:hypothetical protein